MKNIISITTFLLVISTPLHAEDLPFLQAKVKTLVSFKDGTVFVVKQGRVKVGKSGKVLTRPITDAAFGTVGASCHTEGVRIKMLTASAAQTSSAQVQSFEDARKQVHGRPVVIRRRGQDSLISGELLGLRPPGPLTQAIGMPGVTKTDDHILTVKQDNGVVSLIPMSTVESCEFRDSNMIERDPERTGQHLKITLEGAKEGQEVTIAYYYLWHGVRWTPSYLLERDENGSVQVELRGEINNQLIDLNETKLYLVVGVPNFAFHKTPSPMIAQKTITQITSALSRKAPAFYNGFANNAFANLDNSRVSVTSKPTTPIEIKQPAEPAKFAEAPTLPDVQHSGAGNLHLYEVNEVDLAKGERAIIHLTTLDLACGDLVTWDIADARIDTATHQVTPQDRAKNPLTHYWLIKSKDTPLTTGPGLVMRGDVALSQDTIYYTPRHSTGRFKSGNAVGMVGMAEESVLSRTNGIKEVNDRQSSHHGKTFWLKKEIRWVDEIRELVVTVKNGHAFETEMHVSRTFKGIPEQSEELSVQTLGGRTDTVDQINRFTWKGALKPGESKKLKIRYQARIFTKV